MPSYRQAGTRSRGRVVRGMVPKDEVDGAGRTVPSIPSKFETTLHVGTKAPNAFGARTHRFLASDDDLPGPGSYYQPKSLVRDMSTCGSVSKKGFGGLVSKTARFTSRDELESASLPGPLDYVPKAPPGQRTDHSKGATSSAFAPPRRYRDDASLPEDDQPGPGSYRVNKQVTAGLGYRARNPSAAFASRAQRGFKPSVTNPAPGDYETRPSALDRREARRRAKQGAPASSAVFRNNEKRDRHMVLPNAAVPGPGQYDTLASEEALQQRRVRAAQQSAVFVKGQVDRFGRPYQRRTKQTAPPGPGYYAAEKPPRKALVSSSFFMSQSRREERKAATAVVGPSYYDPQPVGKARSFMLNATRKWV